MDFLYYSGLNSLSAYGLLGAEGLLTEVAARFLNYHELGDNTEKVMTGGEI